MKRDSEKLHYWKKGKNKSLSFNGEASQNKSCLCNNSGFRLQNLNLVYNPRILIPTVNGYNSGPFPPLNKGFNA